MKTEKEPDYELEKIRLNEQYEDSRQEFYENWGEKWE